MIVSNGFGQGAPLGSTKNFEHKSPQNETDRSTTETSITTHTEQHHPQAVAPIVEITLTTNNPQKNPEKSKLEAAEKTELEKAKEGSDLKNSQELTEEEEKQVQDLKQRDTEVKAHEQAHAAAGGSYASAPSYEYETGPDNKQYAVSGEVQIDSAAIPNNPEATIRKMDVVIRAATAPADPSSQDKSVASQAQKTRAQAQAQLSQQKSSEENGEDDENSLTASASDETTRNQNPSQQIIEAITAYQTALQL